MCTAWFSEATLVIQQSENSKMAGYRVMPLRLWISIAYNQTCKFNQVKIPTLNTTWCWNLVYCYLNF